jgi:PHS family inorganic phosphate transporter-like MFS transporter
LFDVILYGINLLGGHIVTSFSDDDNVSSLESVRHTTSMQAFSLALGLPAIVLSIYLIPVLGLRRLCLAGFSCMTIVLMAMAGLYSFLLSIHNIAGLYAVYCVLCFTIQFGTAVASFSLPAVLFPKSVRSTYNGIAAAMGKTGAFVGALALYPLAETGGLPLMLALLAVVAATGALVTFVFLDEADLDFGADSSLVLGTERETTYAWSPVHSRGEAELSEHDSSTLATASDKCTESL